MGTDYDPPTRYDDDLGGMSQDTLTLIEREMGIRLGGFLGEKIATVVQQPKAEEEKQEKTKKKGKKHFDRKVDQETKNKRLREWEEGGNPEQKHELVVVKDNEDFVRYY